MRHTLRFNGLYLVTLLLITLFSCKEDRTTIVFGKVVDQNQQPVDSIMILVTGSKSFHAIPITETFSGSDGAYVVNLDVSKDYHALNAFIPPSSFDNPKFYTQYKVSKIFKNGQRTSTCCFSSIGEKTQWDFELEPK